MARAEILRAYGLRVACPFPVPGSTTQAATAGAVDVEVVLAASREALRDAWSGPGPDPVVAHRWVDGRPLDYHRGPAGDNLLLWGTDGAWLVDAGRATVRAHAPEQPPPAEWARVLLDSVLASVALGRGAEALHAGGVVIGGGAVAILGATGAGKTSLVTALLLRGHALLADDVVVLAGGDGPPAGQPAPPVISLAAERAAPAVVAELGEPVARLGEEVWVHAGRVAAGTTPLRALVLLDRRADAAGPPRLEPEPNPFPGLFAHVLHSGAAPERERSRFQAVAALAQAVPVVRLVAPLEGAPPDALAALVESL